MTGCFFFSFASSYLSVVSDLALKSRYVTSVICLLSTMYLVCTVYVGFSIAREQMPTILFPLKCMPHFVTFTGTKTQGNYELGK